MKKTRIILITMILLCAFVLASCNNNNNKEEETTANDAFAIMSTLTTADAKYNFFKNAYEKTVLLEQIDFNQNTTTKEVSEIMTVDSSVENRTVYKKTENGFEASGSFKTVVMNSVTNQEFYCVDNTTYINDGKKQTKTAGDALNVSAWSDKLISKLDFDGVSEISCIIVQNGIKVTIIGETSAFSDGNYQGHLSDYIDENTYVKSYRLAAVINSDGYIIESDDLINLEEQHTVVDIGDFTINKTIRTDLKINSQGADVTITPLDNYGSYEVATIRAKYNSI